MHTVLNRPPNRSKEQQPLNPSFCIDFFRFVQHHLSEPSSPVNDSRQVVDAISTSSKRTPTTSRRRVQPHPHWRKSSQDKSKAAKLWEFKIYRCHTHHTTGQQNGMPGAPSSFLQSAPLQDTCSPRFQLLGAREPLALTLHPSIWWSPRPTLSLGCKSAWVAILVLVVVMHVRG